MRRFGKGSRRTTNIRDTACLIEGVVYTREERQIEARPKGQRCTTNIRDTAWLIGGAVPGKREKSSAPEKTTVIKGRLDSRSELYEDCYALYDAHVALNRSAAESRWFC